MLTTRINCSECQGCRAISVHATRQIVANMSQTLISVWKGAYAQDGVHTAAYTFCLRDGLNVLPCEQRMTFTMTAVGVVATDEMHAMQAFLI